jgi:hypothetical protein
MRACALTHNMCCLRDANMFLDQELLLFLTFLIQEEEGISLP